MYNHHLRLREFILLSNIQQNNSTPPLSLENLYFRRVWFEQTTIIHPDFRYLSSFLVVSSSPMKSTSSFWIGFIFHGLVYSGTGRF